MGVSTSKEVDEMPKSNKKVEETAVVEAAAAAPVELTKRQLFRSQTVTLLRTDNPKKKGSMSYDRFNDYFTLDTDNKPTVDWVLRNTAIRMDDIRHDAAHGFIQLGDAPVANRPAVDGDI